MPPTASPSNALAGWLRLALCGAGLAVVWLGVLPAIGRTSAVREQIESNEAAGIDASVRYYSEQPGLTAFLDRVQTNRRRAGEAFWRPSPIARDNDQASP